MKELTPTEKQQKQQQKKNKWLMCTNEQQAVHADSPSSLKGKDALHGNDALNVDAHRANH